MRSPQRLSRADLNRPPFYRQCSIRATAAPNIDDLRRSLLREEGIESDFHLADAPLPPLDQTRFQWTGNDDILLLGVAFSHSAQLPSRPDRMESESLELLFDLRGDGIGWHQLIFDDAGGYQEFSHLPYPEVHSSSYPLLRPTHWECEAGQFENYLGGMVCRWFWIWFKTTDIFRDTESIGFNIFRSRSSGEFSGWNFPSGNGAPDATGFGLLHHRERIFAERQPEETPGDSTIAGDFKLSVTYDSPDNIVFGELTPERLKEEMRLFKDWGIERVHWIDYRDWPSFFAYESWRDNTAKSFEACGNLTRCAADQAHAQGLEFVADLKLFDLGMSAGGSAPFLTIEDAGSEESLRAIEGPLRAFTALEPDSNHAPELEGDFAAVIPEIAAHQEWTLQSNAAWRNDASGPAAVVRLFSDEPIRMIKPDEVRIFVSRDNRIYELYQGNFSLQQRTQERPHERWTAAGTVRSAGSTTNWIIELSGLEIEGPFIAICIGGAEIRLRQRGYMVLRVENSAGQLLAHTVATSSGDMRRPGSYSFWKEWPGWANSTEPELACRHWNGNNFGFVLRETPCMPTILEPCYTGARQIWLDRLTRIFDDGADAVNLRFLNHHNGVMNYLKYAFAPAVVELFTAKFGRPPEACPEDYQRIRVLRGEALTAFVREAHELARSRGKKLMTQIESGFEVPPHLDTRMQFHIDWKRWIEEKLVDEVHLKFWTPYSRFAHDEVLPLARRHGVPVHIVSRNLSGLVLKARCSETLPQQISDARDLGFNGFNLYEACDLYERNSAGGIWMKGMAEPTLRRTLQYLERTTF